MCFNKFFQRNDIPELVGIFLCISIKVYFQRILHPAHIFRTDMSVIHTLYVSKNIAGVGKKLTEFFIRTGITPDIIQQK